MRHMGKRANRCWHATAKRIRRNTARTRTATSVTAARTAVQPEASLRLRWYNFGTDSRPPQGNRGVTASPPKPYRRTRSLGRCKPNAGSHEAGRNPVLSASGIANPARVGSNPTGPFRRPSIFSGFLYALCIRLEPVLCEVLCRSFSVKFGNCCISFSLAKASYNFLAVSSACWPT